MQRAELLECQQWLRSGGVRELERTYASMVVEQAAGGAGDGEEGPLGRPTLGSRQALQRFVEKRQAAMQAAQQELARERCLQLGSLPERSRDFLTLQARRWLAAAGWLLDLAVLRYHQCCALVPGHSH